jgi:hypothetical protein
VPPADITDITPEVTIIRHSQGVFPRRLAQVLPPSVCVGWRLCS